jgi:hypothetical protein
MDLLGIIDSNKGTYCAYKTLLYMPYCAVFCSTIIIIIMYKKVLVCFLFLDPQDEVGPSVLLNQI